MTWTVFKNTEHAVSQDGRSFRYGEWEDARPVLSQPRPSAVVCLAARTAAFRLGNSCATCLRSSAGVARVSLNGETVSSYTSYVTYEVGVHVLWRCRHNLGLLQLLGAGLRFSSSVRKTKRRAHGWALMELALLWLSGLFSTPAAQQHARSSVSYCYVIGDG